MKIKIWALLKSRQYWNDKQKFECQKAVLVECILTGTTVGNKGSTELRGSVPLPECTLLGPSSRPLKRSPL